MCAFDVVVASAEMVADIRARFIISTPAISKNNATAKSSPTSLATLIYCERPFFKGRLKNICRICGGVTVTAMYILFGIALAIRLFCNKNGQRT